MSETLPWSPGIAGIEKGDVSILLVLDGSSVSTAAITLVEIGANGDYEWRDLPDAETGETYWFRFAYLGQREIYRWPLQTRTPQAVVWRADYEPIPEVLQIGTGDTALPAQLIVRGLASDPTGSTVTFSMRKQVGGAEVIAEAAATLVDVDAVLDQVTGETTYDATVSYTFTAGQTAEDGKYYSWFEVTYPGGGKMTLPGDKKMRIEIAA